MSENLQAGNHRGIEKKDFEADHGRSNPKTDSQPLNGVGAHGKRRAEGCKAGEQKEKEMTSVDTQDLSKEHEAALEEAGSVVDKYKTAKRYLEEDLKLIFRTAWQIIAGIFLIPVFIGLWLMGEV